METLVYFLTKQNETFVSLHQKPMTLEAFIPEGRGALIAQAKFRQVTVLIACETVSEKFRGKVPPPPFTV